MPSIPTLRAFHQPSHTSYLPNHSCVLTLLSFFAGGQHHILSILSRTPSWGQGSVWFGGVCGGGGDVCFVLAMLCFECDIYTHSIPTCPWIWTLAHPPPACGYPLEGYGTWRRRSLPGGSESPDPILRFCSSPLLPASSLPSAERWQAAFLTFLQPNIFVCPTQT